MHRLLFVVLTFLSTHSFFCQSSYQVSWYSADNNYLPQNSVKSIVEDKYGFVWLSTEDGLVRYDGENFKVYNTANIKGIASGRMVLFYGSVARDSLFIETEKNEPILINKRRAATAARTKRGFRFSVKKPFFVLHEESVLGKHLSNKNEFFKILATDSYFIVGNDSIRQFDNNGKPIGKQAFNYPAGSQFFSVGNKLYLLEGAHGYVEFKSHRFQRKTFERSFAGATIYSNPAAHQSFIYAEGNVYQLKSKGTKLKAELVLQNFDFLENNIISVYYSASQKIFYAGSYGKGLAVIKPKEYIASTRKGSDGIYYAVVPFDKDRVITSTGDLFSNEGYEGSLDFREKTDKYMLVVDKAGNLWTKEYRTLSCFIKSTDYKQSNSWTLPDRITTIAKGPDGKIWIGTQTDQAKGELFYISSGNKSAQAIHFLTVPYVINCMNFSSKHGLLVGSEKGLHLLDLKAKKNINIYTAPKAYVRSIYVKNENEIWATTYSNGFVLYRNKKITHFPLDRNNYLLASHCIAEDRQGYFWIPTNKGLFQIKRQQLLDFADKKSKPLYYHYYDKDAGFQSNEFNGGCQPCAAVLNNETIFFPSLNGMVRFQPEKIIPNLPVNKVYMDEAEIDGKIVSVDDTIRLHRDFHRAKFFLSSPYYGNPYNQHMEYNLEGPVHQNWTPLPDGQIVFTRLPPGEYTLTARKITGFTAGYQYRKIFIVIPPPFWQSAWFYASSIVLGASLICMFIAMRIRYIKYKNVLLEKKVALQTMQLHDTIAALRRTKEDLDSQVKIHKKLLKTVTHDIKSPLRFINLTGRLIYLNSTRSPIREDIESIYTSAQQLYNFVDNFLENSKLSEIATTSEPYRLHALVEEKISFFNSIARSKNIALSNSIPVDLSITVNKHLLSIILHNLLDNAIKNTAAGSIVYSSSSEGPLLHIHLKDTGIGMSIEQIRHYQNLIKGNGADAGSTKNGVGLSIVVDLLLTLGGDMKINSSHTSGTHIAVVLPVAV